MGEVGFLEVSWVKTGGHPAMEEILRERVPWLDETLSLVASQAGGMVTLRLVAAGAMGCAAERDVHDVCRFDGGDVVFLKENGLPAGLVSDAERLCLSVMPRRFNPTVMARIMRDPFWQFVLDHMKAAHVMAC